MTEVIPKPSDIFTFPEAVAYLDLHAQTLEHHQRQGNLIPDRQLAGGDRIYFRATLDRFKEDHQSDGLTFQDMAAMYNINRRSAWYAFSVKRNVEPIGKRGRGGSNAYSRNMVAIVAEAEGWEARQQDQEADPEPVSPLAETSCG